MHSVIIISGRRRGRAAVATLLSDSEFRVAATVSPEDDVRSVVAASRPKVVLVDLEQDTPLVELLDAVRAARPTAHPVVLADEDDTEHVVPAVQHGARGVLLRARTGAELVEGLRTVARGDVVVDPRLAAPLAAFVTRGVRVSGPYGLSRREELVVAQLPHQLSNGEIGRRIGISTSTVRTHLRNAMHKLGVADRVEAALFAVEHGLA